MKKNKKVKIYLSLSVGILYLILVFVYASMFPGKFQDLSRPVQIGLIAIVVFGIGYVIYMIEFLPSPPNKRKK